MLREVVISMLISVISGCILPDWKVENKDKMYAGKWYYYKQRVAQGFQEPIARCLYAEVIQDAVNPLKWTILFGFNDRATGKNEVVVINGSSEKENAGLYSYKPPLSITETIVCGDIDGVRINTMVGYSGSCPEKELGVWLGFDNRHNSTHQPTPKEQQKMDECLERNNIDPESLSLIDNDNCTN